jgi:ADP-ribose pyrophosphatase YjhB (NUDIX family)
MAHLDPIPHFVEEGAKNVPSSARLSAELYAQALDSLVIACVDILVTHRDHIFLVKRKTYPHPSWWFIGGRMRAGESPVSTAQRKVVEDIGLDRIAAERFRYVGTFSTQFARRQQPPQENGLHTLNLTYHLTVSPEEIRQIQLCDQEYAESQWIANEAIATYLADDRLMHQVMLQAIQSLNHRELDF